MRSHASKSIVCVAVVAVLAAAGASYAQGVGNPGALPQFIPLDPSGTGWFIGTHGVVRDPNGPKWHKTLFGGPTAPVVAQPGQIFSLSESLFIAGNLPWSDWHEEILTPGWDWVSPIAFMANGVVPSGYGVTNIAGTATQGGTLNFVFDPLPPGTKIDIRKHLQYNGPSGAVFVGTIEIDQYPTPEPASAGLLGLGSLLVLRRRRRR